MICSGDLQIVKSAKPLFRAFQPGLFLSVALSTSFDSQESILHPWGTLGSLFVSQWRLYASHRISRTNMLLSFYCSAKTDNDIGLLRMMFLLLVPN